MKTHSLPISEKKGEVPRLNSHFVSSPLFVEGILRGFWFQEGKFSTHSRGYLGQCQLQIHICLGHCDGREVINFLLLLFIESWPNKESQNREIDECSTTEAFTNESNSIKNSCELSSQDQICAVVCVSQQVNCQVDKVQNSVDMLDECVSGNVEGGTFEFGYERIGHLLSVNPTPFQNDVVHKSKADCQKSQQ